MTNPQEQPDTTADELWCHVMAAKACAEINPSPEAVAVLQAHIDAFEAYFLNQKVVH